jgi:hypothetical protein
MGNAFGATPDCVGLYTGGTTCTDKAELPYDRQHL